KSSQLKEKNKALKAKDEKFKQQKKKVTSLKKEKAEIEAKYLKKLKAAEVKKKNLAKYRINCNPVFFQSFVPIIFISFI
ncbi:MAG: hypothetical protein ACTSWY_07635, partial [Promethearchaeota archaeon]